MDERQSHIHSGLKNQRKKFHAHAEIYDFHFHVYYFLPTVFEIQIDFLKPIREMYNCIHCIYFKIPLVCARLLKYS